MLTSVATTRATTLADLLPAVRWRNAALVLGGALLTALAAQLTIQLPWTPVPITGQTFAVLLTGTALGMRRGAASQLVYVTFGAVGLPFFADGSGGWNIVTGVTGGYLLAYPIVAALVGALAERRHDRALLTSIPAMLAGSAVIYVMGATWLSWKLNVSSTKAIELGVAPFLIGDTIKLLAAGVVGPAAWRFVR